MPTYLTPGPSHPYPKLHDFIEDAWASNVISWSHRSTQFTELYVRTEQALRELMSLPDDYRVYFVGSATEAMERVVEGLVKKHSQHFVLGAFGEKWHQIAEQLGKQASRTDLKPGSEHISEIITPQKNADLLCVTLNETSVGVRMPEHMLGQLAKRPKNQLLALDIVSAAPLIDVNWKQVDVAFFSVQKAFGLPAGLGVIMISETARARAEALKKDGLMNGSYHSLTSLARAADKYQTPETPNVLGIYLLMRVAEDMLEQGIPALRNRNLKRAQQLYAALDKSPYFTPTIKNNSWRSPTVIVADMQTSNVNFVAHLKQHGLIAGKGYAPEHKDQHIRIANFPSISDEVFDSFIVHVQKWSD